MASSVRRFGGALAGVAIGASITALSIAQTPPEPLTLENAISLALANSPSLEQAAARVDSAMAKLDEVASKRGPDFEVRTGFGVVPNNDDGFEEGIGPFVRNDLTVTQPLYTWGKLSTGRQAATYGVRAAEEQARIDRNKLVYDITRLYSLALLARELDDLAGEASDRLGSALKKAQELFDKGDGKVTQKDLARLKIFSAKLRSQALAAHSGVRLSRDALAIAIGLENPEGLKLAEPRLKAPDSKLVELAEYRERGLAARPELIALKNGIAARQALIRIEQKKYFPDLALLGTLRYSVAPDRQILAGSDSFNQFIAGAAFGLRWDFNIAGADAKVDTAQAEARLISAQYQQAVQGITLEIEKAYLDATEARERVQITREGLKAARGWMVAETQLYQLGTGETEDLLTALGAYAEAKKDNIEALQKAIQTTAELERTSPAEAPGANPNPTGPTAPAMTPKAAPAAPAMTPQAAAPGASSSPENSVPAVPASPDSTPIPGSPPASTPIPGLGPASTPIPGSSPASPITEPVSPTESEPTPKPDLFPTPPGP